MYSRVELKEFAREQIKGKIGSIFICLLIAGLIIVASSFTIVGPIILGSAFIISFIRIFIRLSEGYAPEISDIFNGFDCIWKSLVLNILIYVFTMLWSFLFIVPGIIKSISYSMAPFILAENPDMTAQEALNESKRITKGKIGELFILSLSFIPWLLLTMITFGIAGIYVAPYMYMTMTNYYLEIRDL